MNSLCASDSEKNNTCDEEHYCVYSLSSGTATKDHSWPCDQDKDGNYVCPLVESSDEFKNYIKVYRDTLADMDDEEKAEIVDEVTLNNKDVAEAYAKYNFADECIQDFYLQIPLSGNSLKFTLLSLLSIFFILA